MTASINLDKFETEEWCPDGSFGDVFSSYRYLVVSAYKVDFGKGGGAMKLFCKILYFV